ncbi:MAG: PTPA-CTERM sorting domain-containing protein, partial [Phormidesmis sp.]
PYVSLLATQTNGPIIGFNSAITAFGADFARISNSTQGARFEFGDGSVLSIPNRGSGNSAGDGSLLTDGGFFGFTADSAFDSFKIRTVNSSNRFSMDNLSYDAATPVPTPAAILPSLLGMGVAAWRKRKQAAIEGSL